MDAAKPNTTSNWLGNESAKRKRLENSGEEKLLQKLKPLGDVIDLKNPAEVKKLVALVPYMKSDDGGKLKSEITAVLSQNHWVGLRS